VIRPEVDERLLQLPLAVDGAQDARRLQLGRHALRHLEAVLAVEVRDRLPVLGAVRIDGRGARARLRVRHGVGPRVRPRARRIHCRARRIHRRRAVRRVAGRGVGRGLPVVAKLREV
jgi:hypothetical protein